MNNDNTHHQTDVAAPQVAVAVVRLEHAQTIDIQLETFRLALAPTTRTA
jgi:hypothetical protein